MSPAHRVFLASNMATDVRSTLAEVHAEGLDPVVFSSGDRLMNTMRHGVPPELLIVDLGLDGLDCAALAEHLRGSKSGITTLLLVYPQRLSEALLFKEIRGVLPYLRLPAMAQELQMHIRNALDTATLRKSLELSLTSSKSLYKIEGLLGASEHMQWLRTLIPFLKEADEVPMLFRGEHGSGRSHLAKTLHYITTPGIPLEEVNCYHKTEVWLEKALFGVDEPGDQRPGILERANGGTVLLRGVEAVGKVMQRRLREFLDTGTIRRVGGRENRNVRVRILSVAHLNIDRMVAEGRFRQELYNIFSVMTFTLPTLQERGDDVLMLARHFLHREVTHSGKVSLKFTPEAEDALARYTWPGNVEELRQVVSRAVLNRISGDIVPEDLGLPSQVQRPEAPRPFMIDPDLSFVDLEMQYLSHILREYPDRPFSETARILGVSTKTLWEKRRRYGLTGSDAGSGPER